MARYLAASPALASGLLSELVRQHERLKNALAEDSEQRVAAGELAQATQALAEATHALRQHQLDAGQNARELAQHNGDRASIVQQLGRLKTRAQALRDAQIQATDPETMRKLRRQRAAVDVQVQELDAQANGLNERAQTARSALNQTHAAIQEAGTKLRQAQVALYDLQKYAAPLHKQMQFLEARFALAHCRLQAAHLGKAAKPADLVRWQHAVTSAHEEVSRVHGDMARGRFVKDLADNYAGGRAAATAEALYTAVACDRIDQARGLFLLACPEGQFFAQISGIYKCWCLGLYLTGARKQLVETLRIFRFAQGLRGALSGVFWALIAEDNEGFVRALNAFVAADWRAWQRQGQPSLGVICASGAAMLRLGIAKGFEVPALRAPTMPEVLALSCRQGIG